MSEHEDTCPCDTCLTAPFLKRITDLEQELDRLRDALTRWVEYRESLGSVTPVYVQQALAGEPK